jgi:hypothetical protein
VAGTNAGPDTSHTHPFDLFLYIPTTTTVGQKVPVFVYSGEGYYAGMGIVLFLLRDFALGISLVITPAGLKLFHASGPK